MTRTLPRSVWAIGTSGTRDTALIRLRYAGVHIPDVLVTADDVTHGKPHPEVYLKAAELLHVRPEDCIVIEDTPAGIASGRAAGMRVIGVATTYPKEALHAADSIAERLSDISVKQEDVKAEGTNARLEVSICT